MFKKRKYSSYNESDLIDEAKNSQLAFGELYNRNFDAVYRFVFKRLGGNADLSGEITQQTFIKAFAAINKYEDRGFAFSTWLIRISQNEINMFFRKQKKSFSVQIEEKHVIDFMVEINISQPEEINKQQLVIEILNKMKSEHADLIELRFFQQKSFKEIGDIYKISEANAKMRVYRILEKIKKEASK